MQEKIKLADDKEYLVTTFNVGDLIELEKKFGTLQLSTKKIETIIFYLWLSIKKAHKDLTLEKLYELIDSPFIAQGGIVKIFEAMSKVNGWQDLPKNEQPPQTVTQ